MSKKLTLSPEVLREAIEAELTKRLETLEKIGVIQPFCEYHHREFVCVGDVGEFCSECAADGGVGELCNLGCDSEAIAAADAILKTIGANP